MSTTEAPAPAPEAAAPRQPGRVERWSRRLTEANLFVVTVLAVILGLLVGAILIIATTGQSFGGVGKAYAALFDGSVFNPSSIGHAISSGRGWNTVFAPISETLVAATPLIFAGLGVAMGFSTGVFNIGGQGQLICGALCATYVGFGVRLPVWVHLPLVVLAGAAGGAVAGFIPGFLKAWTGAHEVIVTIMLNYVFLYLLSYLLVTAPLQQPNQSNSISRTVPQSARLPFLFGGGLRVNAGILLAVAAVAAVWWVMQRSTLGFRFRVIGSNAAAGRAAGINSKLVVVLVMTLSGALVGLAGMATLAGTDFYLSTGYGGEAGFTAITVALLGRNNPRGVLAGAVLFGAFTAGGRYMEAHTGIPFDLVSVIQAVIVFFVATPALVQEIFRLRSTPGEKRILLFTKGWAG